MATEIKINAVSQKVIFIVESPPKTLSELRDYASGTGISNISSGNTSPWYSSSYVYLSRLLFVFDISAVPIGATILDIKLGFNLKSVRESSTDFDIVKATPSSPTSIVKADFSEISTNVLGSFTSGDLTTGVYSEIDIDKTDPKLNDGSDYYSVGVRFKGDTDNTSIPNTSGINFTADSVPYLSIIVDNPPPSLTGVTKLIGVTKLTF